MSWANIVCLALALVFAFAMATEEKDFSREHWAIFALVEILLLSGAML